MTVVIGVAGCGTGDGTVVTVPAAGPEPSVSMREAAIRLPFDAYMLPAEAQAGLDAEMQQRALDCVERAGLDAVIPVQATTPQPWYTARRYHVLFEVDAQRFGLRSPEAPTGPGPVQELLARMPTEMQEEWSVAHERCTVRGRAEVPYLSMLAELVNRWDNESYAGVETDSRVPGLIEEWSECMQAEGYSYPSPTSVFEDSQFVRETGAPSVAEVEVASAHARCDQRVDRLRRMAAIESEYQHDIVSRNNDFFGALLQAKDNAARTVSD